MRSTVVLNESVASSSGFLDLSPRAQALYVQLCFAADGVGCVEDVRRVLRLTGAGPEAVEELRSGDFLIEVPDENGEPLLFIAHWWVSNKFDAFHFYPGGNLDVAVSRLGFVSDSNKRYRLLNEGEESPLSAFVERSGAARERRAERAREAREALKSAGSAAS